jgi:hypothetical protein
MSNESAKERLHSRLYPEGEDVWAIIRELAAPGKGGKAEGKKGELDKAEDERRRILRPHAEMRFGNDPESKGDREQRRRLDVALGALTVLEIAYETGVVKVEEERIPEPECLKVLIGSEAFLRYLNAYLYFGIRFLAWRIMPPEWYRPTEPAKPDTQKTDEKQLLPRQSNQQFLQLEKPPTLDPEQLKKIDADSKCAALIHLAESCDPAIPGGTKILQKEALRFLDGFAKEGEEGGEEGNNTQRSYFQQNTASEPERFELWLRGLLPKPLRQEELAEESRFWAIAIGLIEWTIARRDFYLSLRNEEQDGQGDKRDQRPDGGWVVTDPLAARFALADVYWISRLLKAEVSSNATVTYSPSNWLHLLRFRVGLHKENELARLDTNQLPPAPDLLSELWKAEEVLRSVFDFVCDLIQNAVEITQEKEKERYEPGLFTKHPGETAKWRKVFDEELNEIERQRNLRKFKKEKDEVQKDQPSAAGGGASGGGGGGNTKNTKDNKEDDDWMERIRKIKPICNLVGISFSGGGIRSATFNLGVLQGLQELDLLRKIDFISTVSGGGFIGSWLVANVYRTRHWLGRLVNWDDSIDHLRRYSNYLAPRLGMFSGDTWTMWVSWARNAFLIQITGLAWLWALLLLALLGEKAFRWCGRPISALIAAVLMGIVVFTLLYNLSTDRAVTGKPTKVKNKFFLWLGGNAVSKKLLPWLALWLSSGRKPLSETWTWALAIVPAWAGSFLLAAAIRGEYFRYNRFNQVVETVREKGWHPYQPQVSPWILARWSLLVWIALALLAFVTLSRLERDAANPRLFQANVIRRLWHAAWIGLPSTIVLAIELFLIVEVFIRWSAGSQFDPYAYVFGPPLVLIAHTVSVVLFIGFCGKNSKESIREWWTRFGAGLAMFGAGYMALTAAAVFGPAWILFLLSLGAIKWGSIIGWIGTVTGGLLAGKSSKTNGNDVRNKSPWLQILAKLGGFVFIVGAILAASTALYVLLACIAAPERNWHGYWQTVPYISRNWLVAAFIVTLLCGALFSRFFEINIFGLNQFYRFRLVRCYLGATRWAPGLRKPQPFTSFDGEDDIKLGDLAKKEFRGPFPIYSCALNLSGSSDLALHTRHSASFFLTPLWCGADRRRVGYAPTSRFADGIMLGQAVAISGAAASPNMGFNTSPLVAFLLTMFNVRLGWWFPNPGQKLWDHPGLSFSLYYLLRELFGVADEKSKYVNVSDGGHFENLGVYELIRRRCKVIIVCDAECDEFLQFGSLGNLVRVCETDFGAKIDINVNSIRLQKDSFSLAHCTIGHVFYCNGSMGYIIYLKSSITGDEDVGIAQYRSIHPSFPHETTADQFFSEDQFESYRRLGRHVVQQSLRGTRQDEHPAAIAERLFDVLVPAGCSSEAFIKHTRTLDGIWERFRETPELHPFFEQLMQPAIGPTGERPRPAIRPLRNAREEEKILGLELIQLMENVFLDLRLDDFWAHPDNRGWAILFMRWARSPRLREIWQETRRTFGIRFEYFCQARLGLTRDDPIVRV